MYTRLPRKFAGSTMPRARYCNHKSFPAGPAQENLCDHYKRNKAQKENGLLLMLLTNGVSICRQGHQVLSNAAHTTGKGDSQHTLSPCSGSDFSTHVENSRTSSILSGVRACMWHSALSNQALDAHSHSLHSVLAALPIKVRLQPRTGDSFAY